MSRYIKLYTDNKRRQNFKEKSHRFNRLSLYLLHTKNHFPITIIKNYCQVTGASKSIYSNFGISRHILRVRVNFGLINGVIASSW